MKAQIIKLHELYGMTLHEISIELRVSREYVREVLSESEL